jgi:hypothetical protein
MKSDGGILTEVYLSGTTTRFRRAATVHREETAFLHFDQQPENKVCDPDGGGHWGSGLYEELRRRECSFQGVSPVACKSS